MEELRNRALAVKTSIDRAANQLNLPKQTEQIATLRAESEKQSFWDNASEAQGQMKQLSKLENRAKPWQDLGRRITELISLIELKDDSLKGELTNQLSEIEASFNDLKQDLKLSGPYDDHDAIISLYAGAGGTDAQDWTQILFRMYQRFTEKNGWRTKVLEQSAGDEAGLKSLTMTVDGDYVYGKLKGESGVHRLVRLSPFNADHLRQTSFAKVDVMPKINQPSEAVVDDKDLKIDVFRSGGHGGQSVNTTDSAVRLTHIPTGLSVVIQNERSQLQNKETAMTVLRSRLISLQLEQHNLKLGELKGPNQSAEWGNQIRSYVLHPYKQVKDLRTKYESSDPEAVLDGALEPFIEAYLDKNIG